MGKIERFEDIQAWQKARFLVRELYAAINSEHFAKDFGLHDQWRREASSIILNIAEGFARRTKKEFSQFLVATHGSTAEVQLAQYIALDQGYISEADFERLYKLADEVSIMIMSFSRYLSNSTKSKNSTHSTNSRN